MNQPTCAQALAAAQTLGLERLDAQLLLLQALGQPGKGRAWLLAHDTDELPEEVALRFQALSLRRLGGEPLAYIVGHKEFFGLRLQVDARVLVPRPDTETLVQWTLDLLQAPGLPPHPQLLDLGTGSGAIALALKHAQPACQVSAIDFSADALALAQANARALGLEVQFSQGSWLDNVSGHYHAIVSNPPYIADHDPHLAALSHEPARALTSGTDGLDAIRQIVCQAPARLQPGGWLLLEHGYDQAALVRGLLRDAGFEGVQSRRDLGGIERCSGGQWRPGSRAGQTAG
ncbi:peptide chain release factor N(5)-glutamine methyltransferase [Polaromonas sp.]|uniref:peptide chain release factor N(5)-glutamine methyltransferase n=1 Tax=Polaromonas sp. TaxID=1869339 RepID=UPI00286B43C3|nr:peptide chain release factor N(5)-glutamine methyltransferase [Polaromonas sp.]